MATPEQNRILIVDDDPGIRSLMAKHFKRRGFEVEQAEAAEEVIERYGGVMPRFDVVLTDVHLPGESGVDLARRIKEAQPQQAVVFMTGDADASVAREALQSGAYSFLVKPFEFTEIERSVRNAIQRRMAAVSVATQVVLAPARPRRTFMKQRARVGVAIAAMITLGLLAGFGLGPSKNGEPVQETQVMPAATGGQTTVVPVVIERSVYTR